MKNRVWITNCEIRWSYHPPRTYRELKAFWIKEAYKNDLDPKDHIFEEKDDESLNLYISKQLSEKWS